MGSATTRGWMLGAAATGALLGGCGGDDGDKAAPRAPAATVGITEDKLPTGFSKTPTIELRGRTWRFDNVPGHYWKVLDDRGYAVGLHFQTKVPFPWAKDARPGEVLYLVYAIPGNCGDGSFAKAVKSKDATIVGRTPAGFDHWHALVGGRSKVGHWLMHVPVRDFTLAGPPAARPARPVGRVRRRAPASVSAAARRTHHGRASASASRGRRQRPARPV